MRTRKDDGFTMIELIAVMALMGLLAALVAGPFQNWRESRGHKDAATSVVSAMRNAQVRAVAESTRYRVAVTESGAAVVVYRSPASGEPERQVSRFASPSTSVRFSSPSFSTGSGPSTSAYFYPRGSASAGSLTVTRSGRDPIRIDVEGLTGRVTQDR